MPGDDADVPLDDTRRLGVPASESAPREPAIFVSGVSLRDDALRACAALRVQCFYRYDHENRDPDGALLFGEASERARRAWLERRLQSEMNRGRRLTDLGMRVSTFAATRAAPDAATLARERDALAQAEAEESARWDLNAPLVRQKASANDASDPSTSERFDGGRSAASAAPARCLIPPPRGAARREGARESRETEVVGTVDLHVGARLPGEFLEGALPRRGDDESDDARDDESDDARDDARETRASDGSSAVRAAASPGPEPASPPASGEGGVAVTVAAAAAFTATAASDDALVATCLSPRRRTGERATPAAARWTDAARTCSTCAWRRTRAASASRGGCSSPRTRRRRGAASSTCIATWSAPTPQRGACTRASGTSRRRRRATGSQ